MRASDSVSKIRVTVEDSVLAPSSTQEEHPWVTRHVSMHAYTWGKKYVLIYLAGENGLKL